MSRFWSDFVHQLVPYVPGEQPKIANLIKLNTNENPYPPSAKAIAAIQAELGANLKLYPDPNSDVLKQAIADFYAIDKDFVFVGNGSDEVLAHVFQAFFKQQHAILFPDISYSFYPVYCNLYGIAFEQVPLTERFTIDVRGYQKKNGGIIFPNPNAPTGVALSLAEIEQLLQKNTDSVVVVDEAYVDFGAESAVALVQRYNNLLITQTLSKSRSLAGLRVGLAIAQPHLIEALNRVKDSFNSYPLDRLAIVGAAAAFADKDWFNATRQQVIASREKLTTQLQALGFDVLPSSANFIFAKHKHHDAAQLSNALRARSIIVRHFKAARIEQFLRITIGTDEQNQSLVTALQQLVV